MLDQWRVNFKLLEEEFATPNWNEVIPSPEAIAELGGYKACKALIPPTAEAWCIYSRKEGGSWEEQGGLPGPLKSSTSFPTATWRSLACTRLEL